MNKIEYIFEKNKLIKEIKKLLDEMSKGQDKNLDIDQLNSIYNKAKNIKNTRELKKVKKEYKKYIIKISLEKKISTIESRIKLFSNNDYGLTEKELKDILGPLDKAFNSLTNLLEGLEAKQKFESKFVSDEIKYVNNTILGSYKKELLIKLEPKRSSIEQASLYFTGIHRFYEQLKVTIENIKLTQSYDEFFELGQALATILKSIEEEQIEEKIKMQEEINQLNISLEKKENLTKELEKVYSLNDLVNLKSELKLLELRNFTEKLNEKNQQRMQNMIQEHTKAQKTFDEFHEKYQNAFTEGATPLAIKYLLEWKKMQEQIKKEQGHPKK